MATDRHLRLVVDEGEPVVRPTALGLAAQWVLDVLVGAVALTIVGTIMVLVVAAPMALITVLACAWLVGLLGRALRGRR